MFCAQPAPPTGLRPHHETTALRGFAALFVVWHHIVVFPNLLDPGYRLRGIFSYGPPGHFRVLIFFVLSGYVIGLTNKQPLTWKTGPAFLRKRLVRLYPIYLLTTGLALLVSTTHYSWPTILGNALLLQGAVVPDINPVAWVIPYEMLYYVVFLLLSCLRLNLGYLAAASFLLAFGNCALYASTGLASLTSYGYGLLFWLAGLSLSRWLGPKPTQPTSSKLLLAGVFILLSSAHFNLLDTLLHRLLPLLGLPVTLPAGLPWGTSAISIYDLASIPTTVLTLCLFTGKQLPHKRWLAWGLVVFAAVQWVVVAWHALRGEVNTDYYALPSIFLLAAALCAFARGAWLESASRYLVQAGSWLGTFSYGIYLVHFPLLLGFGRVKLLAGSQGTFALRLGLLFTLVLVLGYLLEGVLQPRLQAYLLGGAPRAGRSGAAPQASVTLGS